MARKKNKKKHRGLWLFLKLQIVLIIIVFGAIAYYYGGGYAEKIAALKDDAENLVEQSTPDTFRRNETSIAYDVNGNRLSVMKNGKDSYYLDYDEIPENAKLAAVSIEDKKFYKHKGVDYKAIIRAVWAMIRNGEIKQGASTITQQLARNVFLNQDKTWQRKIEEIYVAVELEKKYSKSQILEFYLNNIYFANGYYGLEAASQGYFSKGSEDLSLSQTAFLIAIPNRPNLYDPVSHIENTLKRRDRILKAMYSDGVISETQYLEATEESITLSRPARVYNNYAETYMYYCATRALMKLEGFKFKKNFSSEDEEKSYEAEYKTSYEENNKKLFTGGYRIYTSIDMNVQNKLQSTIDDKMSFNTETTSDGVYTMQSAGVCIDNLTGTVKAIVGGRTQDIGGYTLNRAFQSFRQPGSSIKPLIVYTPALENGYTPDTMVKDEPFDGGPDNVDGKYMGEITLRTAVEKSRNTVAWSIFNTLSPKKCLEYLHKMGFQKITANDEVPAASIGGLSNGVSPLEMAMGFETIENDGNMRMPTCILKITNSSGDVLYQNKQEETSIYKRDSARTMTDILTGVMTNGTAKGYGLTDMPCAGKTGTTNDQKDGWFVGYTRYYTTSVWVGYDNPKTIKGLSGGTIPLYIWHDFMQDIHTGLPAQGFLPALGDVQTTEDGSTQPSQDQAASQAQTDQDQAANQTQTGQGQAANQTQTGQGQAASPTQPSQDQAASQAQTDQDQAANQTQPGQNQTNSQDQP